MCQDCSATSAVPLSASDDSKLTCQICGKKWKSLKSVFQHTRQIHNTSKTEYIEKYFKINIDKNNILQCQICGKLFNYICGLSKHLYSLHNYTTTKQKSEYYDLYLKKDNSDICVVCGNKNKFINFEIGYRKTCSLKCDNERKLKSLQVYNESRTEEDYETFRKKSEETMMIRYGVPRFRNNPKRIKTMEERYGKDWGKDFGNVVNKRMQEKYGDDYGKIRYELGNTTKQNKYGDPHYLNPEKRKSTMLERYGAEHSAQVPEILIKMIENKNKTMRADGRYSPLESWSEYKKYRELVRKETNLHIKRIYDEWNGRCYYTDEELNAEADKTKDSKAPTTEHKISCLYGFINNIDPKIIGGYDNLAICGRGINIFKSSRIEEEFKKILKEREIINTIKDNKGK